ncbi:tyrosine-protein phosphatase non-receptor type substrate 1-like isoform X2 [Rhineura floridana]|uniref:tyrosine-protein phosphatase non-receptor type substrate 1-like isoform X2 n=1 Tax=Rhineura floridana TaxID=261503 RepID=UPI002AC7F39C|nr:tyrosine-protein phosphatase non-receptor type substrate 1-like isoform X2 [Rhineura floridana]
MSQSSGWCLRCPGLFAASTKSASQMAFKSSFLGLLFGALLSPSSGETRGEYKPQCYGATDQEVEVNQPQGSIVVQRGDNLTLECKVTGGSRAGPVKWYLGEVSRRTPIYQDTKQFERVTRKIKSSSSDFTIFIHNVTFDDAGTYYCVKFKTEHKGEEVVKCGRGTHVQVKASQDDMVIPVAAGVGCFLLAILLFVAVYFYTKKKRGRNHCTSRPEVPCPEKTTGNKEIIYADLQESRGPQRPKQSKAEEHSEYAVVQVTQSG